MRTRSLALHLAHGPISRSAARPFQDLQKTGHADPTQTPRIRHQIPAQMRQGAPFPNSRVTNHLPTLTAARISLHPNLTLGFDSLSLIAANPINWRPSGCLWTSLHRLPQHPPSPTSCPASHPLSNRPHTRESPNPCRTSIPDAQSTTLPQQIPPIIPAHALPYPHPRSAPTPPAACSNSTSAVPALFTQTRLKHSECSSPERCSDPTPPTLLPSPPPALPATAFRLDFHRV